MFEDGSDLIQSAGLIKFQIDFFNRLGIWFSCKLPKANSADWRILLISRMDPNCGCEAFGITLELRIYVHMTYIVSLQVLEQLNVFSEDDVDAAAEALNDVSFRSLNLCLLLFCCVK